MSPTPNHEHHPHHPARNRRAHPDARMTTVTPKLADLINHAELNGKPEVAAALKLLRDPVAALEAERDDAVSNLGKIAGWLSETIILEGNETIQDFISPGYQWIDVMRQWAEDENKTLKARIAELEARTGPVPAQWRPIGEAPRDTPMQVMTKKYGPVSAIHKSGWGEPSSVPGNYPLQATHFCPLPKPPTE